MLKVTERVCDLPFRHKEVASVILGLPLELLVQLGLTYVIKDEAHLLDLATTIEFLPLFSFGVWNILKTGEPFKTPRSVNFARALTLYPSFIYGSFNPSEESIETVRKLLSLYNNPGDADLKVMQAEVSMQRGDLAKAITLWKEAAERLEEAEDNIFGPSVYKPALQAIHRIRKAVGRDLRTDLAFAFSMQFLGYEKLALDKTWPRVLAAHPDSLEIRILHGICLGRTERKEEKEETWRELIDDIRKGKYKGASLEKVADSRNEVVEIGGNKQLRQTVIVKRGKKLRKEADVLDRISKETRKRQLVATPVVYIPGEVETLVTFRKPLVTIDEALKEREVNVDIAMHSLARFHSLELPELSLTPFSPNKELERRLIGRLGYNKFAYALLEANARMYEHVDREKHTTIHGDFYPSNILVDGTIIDLEKVARGLASIDLETFLSHPEIKDEERFARTYQRERKDDTILEREYATVFVAICQIGSFLAKGDIKTAEYFIRRALDRIDATGLNIFKDPLQQYLESKVPLLVA